MCRVRGLRCGTSQILAVDEERIKIGSSSEKESSGSIKGWFFLSQEQHSPQSLAYISAQ